MSGTGPIRVMVVDDSVVVRRILKGVFAEASDIEVVGYAANGKIALMKIPQVQPDLITLDVEMPEMDGFELLRQMRQKGLKIPVIMFSTLTAQGAVATLDALALGAGDYVAKPANVGSVTESIQKIRDDLLPKIRALCPHKGPPAALPLSAARPAASAPITLAPPGRRAPVRVLTIGCSTGGPNALIEVLPQLPESFPVPIVLVQHMPKMFTKILADRLDDRCALEVVEAVDGQKLRAGCAYIAPGEHHMVVRNAGAPTTGLNQDAQENYCRPSVDVLFRSVAALYGDSTLAVILTGMGQDGMLGCEEIRRRGGQIVVQDEASSVVWGMPGAVARRGIADAVLPLSRIAPEIMKRLNLVGAGAGA